MTRGILVRFARTFDVAANRTAIAFSRRLYESAPTGVQEIIPGLVSVYVEFDDKSVSENRVGRWLQGAITGAASTSRSPGKRVEIKVSYEGIDLESIANRKGISQEELVARHSARDYTVFMVGFSPGQPYLGMLDETIRVPRRKVPRKHVPPLSVAMANEFTSVTAFAQPAGWDVIGHACVYIYDPNRPDPALLSAGDTVRFIPCREPRLPELDPLELLPSEPERPFLVVRESGLLDLIVDQGRLRVGQMGLARSGAIDPASARLANQLLGNHSNAPVIEVNVNGPLMEVLRDGAVSTTGRGLHPYLNGVPQPTYTSFPVRKGDRLAFSPVSAACGARLYVAVAGGIESGTFFGSASVTLRGKVGRPLRDGDLLGAGPASSVRTGFSYKPPALLHGNDYQLLRLVPGPQYSPQAMAELTSAEFTVVTGDRVGLRLSGSPVSGGEIVSEAVPIGSVQVPPGGDPILLLNDRGTTGGYEKPAILHPAELAKAAQLTPGARVRFQLDRRRPSPFRFIDV